MGITNLSKRRTKRRTNQRSKLRKKNTRKKKYKKEKQSKKYKMNSGGSWVGAGGSSHSCLGSDGFYIYPDDIVKRTAADSKKGYGKQGWTGRVIGVEAPFGPGAPKIQINTMKGEVWKKCKNYAKVRVPTEAERATRLQAARQAKQIDNEQHQAKITNLRKEVWAKREEKAQ